jgi:hypothetical protein
MSKRRGASPPFFRQAHLLKPAPAGSETAAATQLAAERGRRAGACLAEVLQVLERYNCTFQIITQDIHRADQPGSQRVCQINVLPLEGDPANAGNGGKPAA